MGIHVTVENIANPVDEANEEPALVEAPPPIPPVLAGPGREDEDSSLQGSQTLQESSTSTTKLTSTANESSSTPKPISAAVWEASGVPRASRDDLSLDLTRPVDESDSSSRNCRCSRQNIEKRCGAILLLPSETNLNTMEGVPRRRAFSLVPSDANLSMTERLRLAPSVANLDAADRSVNKLATNAATLQGTPTLVGKRGSDTFAVHKASSQASRDRLDTSRGKTSEARLKSPPTDAVNTAEEMADTLRLASSERSFNILEGGTKEHNLGVALAGGHATLEKDKDTERAVDLPSSKDNANAVNDANTASDTRNLHERNLDRDGPKHVLQGNSVNAARDEVGLRIPAVVLSESDHVGAVTRRLPAFEAQSSSTKNVNIKEHQASRLALEYFPLGSGIKRSEGKLGVRAAVKAESLRVLGSETMPFESDAIATDGGVDQSGGMSLVPSESSAMLSDEKVATG